MDEGREEKRRRREEEEVGMDKWELTAINLFACFRSIASLCETDKCKSLGAVRVSIFG